jgi:hypothetical protein
MTAALQHPRSGPGKRLSGLRGPSRRAPRHRVSRLANRLAGRKTAPGIFWLHRPETRPESPLQLTETHQESATYVFVFVSGCAVAPNSAGASQQVAIIINGSTFDPFNPNGSGLGSSGNPLGHVAVAVQGDGVFSYGNGTPSGSSTTDYLNAQAALRDTTVIILDVTPQQASGTANYFQQNSNIPVTLWGNNCVAISNTGLTAGGINLTELVPGPGPNGVIQVPVGNLPIDMQNGAMNYINNNGGSGNNSGYYIVIPKGSPPPAYLQTFNPSG